jgi:acyl-CoA reductase-like NAD-dependent aldehyde dehydrogenase
MIFRAMQIHKHRTYERFMEKAIKRVESIRQGDPFNMSTQIGAQVFNDQFEKILSYIDIGKKEGAKVLTGGSANKLAGDLAGGYYIKPTVFEGHNKMRISRQSRNLKLRDKDLPKATLLLFRRGNRVRLERR